MRKTLSILLLVTFIFNISGYYLCYVVFQYMIHQEMMQKIQNGLYDDELTCIIVPDNDNSSVSWTEPGKEFRYKEEMFDVIKMKIHNGQHIYYCINDKKEQQLIAAYSKTHQTKKETEKRNRKTFNFQFRPTLPGADKFASWAEICYPSIVSIFESNIPKIPFPPPEITDIV